MDFYCENYEKSVVRATEMTNQEQNDLLNEVEETKIALCALLLLFKRRKLRKINIDDWECDLENILLKK
jgi:hypothetical protein